jgi:hypothetical protein
MRRRTQLIITVVILAIAALGFLIWSANRGITSPMFRHPEANAYEALIFAAKQMGNISADPSPAEFTQSVTNNATALKLMRAALEKPFEAPEAVYDPQANNANLNNVGTFKALALAAKREGTLAEQNGDYASAARSYVDIIRLGQTIQAGPLIFMLVGVSIERIGVEALTELEPNITGDTRSQTAAALKQLNETRLPFAEVEMRERYFSRRASPTPIHYLIFSRHLRAAMNKGNEKHTQAYQSLDAIASKLAQPTPRTPTAAPGE